MKKFQVKGYCLVPHSVCMEIEANSPEEAILKAKSSDWRYHIESNSGDERSADEWEPFAEEISCPTDTQQP